jgi:hypothetical protein
VDLRPNDFSRPEHLTFEWGKISALDRLQLIFDTSIDNSLAVFQGDTNCQWGGYPAASVPAAVKDYRVLVRETPQGPWIQVLNVAGNYQRLRNHSLKGLRACALRLEILSTNGLDRAQVYGVRILTPARCTSSVPSAMAGAIATKNGKLLKQSPAFCCLGPSASLFDQRDLAAVYHWAGR